LEVDTTANPPSQEVTDIVATEIKAGREADFDNWFQRFLGQQRKAPGYLGTTILSPPGNGADVRIVITRFKDRDSLDSWKKNEERLKMVEEVKAYSSPHYHRATGQETWFSIPGMTAAAPPRWKMSIVTFFPAYIISALAFTLLHPMIVAIPFLLANVIITFILVMGLTYVAMPALAKLLRRWLYPHL
jgi:uncharacterized protein